MKTAAQIADHRARNALQMVMSLINLARGEAGPDAAAALNALAGRIEVIACVFHLVDGDGAIDRIPLDRLVDIIERGSLHGGADREAIRGVWLETDRAIALALLLHELADHHGGLRAPMEIALDATGAVALVTLRLFAIGRGDDGARDDLPLRSLAEQLKATVTRSLDDDRRPAIALRFSLGSRLIAETGEPPDQLQRQPAISAISSPCSTMK